MVLTYDRKNLLPEKKVQSVIWPAMFLGGFKLQPEKITTQKKKGTVIWPTVEIHVFERVQITTGKNYTLKKNVQLSGRRLK
jgi:hypothetical protein